MADQGTARRNGPGDPFHELDKSLTRTKKTSFRARLFVFGDRGESGAGLSVRRIFLSLSRRPSQRPRDRRGRRDRHDVRAPRVRCGDFWYPRTRAVRNPSARSRSIQSKREPDSEISWSSLYARRRPFATSKFPLPSAGRADPPVLSQANRSQASASDSSSLRRSTTMRLPSCRITRSGPPRGMNSPSEMTSRSAPPKVPFPEGRRSVVASPSRPR